MTNSKRVIEPSSKQAVQRFNRSFELLEPLPEKAQKILAVLGADGVASEAVRIANCVKSNVSYWKDRFIKAGALRLKQDGIVKYYELAPSGLIHYGAPEGLHDDTVIMLALAAWQIKNLERTAEPSWVMG